MRSESVLSAVAPLLSAMDTCKGKVPLWVGVPVMSMLPPVSAAALEPPAGNPETLALLSAPDPPLTPIAPV